VTFGATLPIPESLVDAVLPNRWLRSRLITPITISSDARLNMVRATQLPKVRQVRLEVHLLRPLSQGLLPDVAFSNAVPIDLSNNFFPFGEKPKLNDTLYLASAEAFSKDAAQGLATTGATVQLGIQVANSHLLPTATSVRPSADVQLAWECWNGTAWQRVGTSQSPAWLRLLEVTPPPEVTTDASVTVEGRAQRGAVVRAQISGQIQGSPTRTVRVGEDGRLALTVVSPSGLIVIAFIATFGGQTTRAWATFFQETGNVTRTIALTVSAPPQPVQTDTVILGVNVTGSNAAQVRQIRVTNGSLPTGQPVLVPAASGTPTSVVIPLVEGRNELLIEGLADPAAQVALAATTLTVGREARPPTPEAGTGFIDGTYAFSQSGIVRFTLPNQIALTSVNGQENFWLRVRLIRGDYGKEASYKLKNPEAPEEGFIIVLENFRPPVLASVNIGYEQTLNGAPEVMLAYNNSTFTTVTNATDASGPGFVPFNRAPEDRPTLYLAFTLPSEQAIFPNRTLSLYMRVADVKYGERPLPIAPESSKKFGAPASVVRHQFTVSNPEPLPARFTFSILGTQWQPAPVPPPTIDWDPTKPQEEVEVPVTIPDGTPPGSSDRGFLKLTISTQPGLEYTADFVTFAGVEAMPGGERLRLIWEYWNGREWSMLTVRDDTENFTRPGLIEFLAPSDFTMHPEFGQPPRYWLRVSWVQGEYALVPKLCRILLNTTMASQTVTIRNEVLGSSDGSGEQQFFPTQTPVLLGQRLEVREPEMPAAAEQEIITREEGADAITLIPDATGRPREIWVRWHEVSDFYGSGPRDRHYVLDHLTGEIRTGDGLHGLIPPIGRGNLRLAWYQVGGGNAGNKPAGTIVQLKTTVPYVDKVTNTEAAAGGADAETLDSLLGRAPRTIRHGGRAVTIEDYEDLAMLASPEVARARCIPLRNLRADPLGAQPMVRGEVSVIIVPRSREAKPQPSLELLSRVQDYLEVHSVPTAHVSVVGPLYVRVDVHAQVALVSLEGASAVEQAVQQKLASFLHPLTGGLDGAGWDFGRKPHHSDVYALIEAVPGVDHIRSLVIDETEDQSGVSSTGRFLVFSGMHKVDLVFEAA